MEQSTYYIFASLAATSAAAAFIYSVYKGRQDILRSREVSARAAWEAYLEMAFENPDLARAEVKKADADKFEKYEWFVSRMLYAAEEVLTLSGQSKPWTAAIKSQMSFHSAYLAEQGLQYMNHYSDELQSIYRQEFPTNA
jgi:hypothetical protein